MLTLRKRLSEILFEKSGKPTPKSTPCWEWISDTFLKTVNEMESYEPIHITFYLYKNGELTYAVSLQESNPCPEEKLISKFSVEEVVCCSEIANYNGIGFAIVDQPILRGDNPCVQVIQFYY